MHLLSRKISPYTGADQCLGAFRTRDEANQAKAQYIAALESGQRDDPWSEQAYHQVDLSQDVCVMSEIPVSDVSADAAVVHVVSLMAEGFGQIIREYRSINGTGGGATAVAASLDESSDDMQYSHIETIVVGQLQWKPRADQL
jgi:Hypothetical methyltransferase